MAFVKNNDRVRVYEDPMTRQKLEGIGQVVGVQWCKDDEAMVDVVFNDDDEDEWGDYPRRITPECVIK